MTSAEEPVSHVEAQEAQETMETAETTETTATTPRALTPIPEADPSSESPKAAFHPDADLQVVVRTPNDDVATYMVCASALACASQVWRTMLYRDAARSHNAENDTKQEHLQTMRLVGDAEAIGLLFRVVHYKFNEVPKHPTLDQLYELSKGACEYRCTHILHPWATSWSASLKNFVAEAYCYSECHKALHIAWTFGELKLYRETVDALIVSAEIGPDGKVVNVSGKPLEDMLMHRDLLDIIIETRASTIARILDAVNDPLQVLLSGEQDQRNTYCKVGKDSQACEIMMLGSVIAALTHAKLFPIPKPQNFTGSIKDLKDRLDKVKTVPYVGKDWMPHMSHENCNLGFRNAVMICLKEMMVPLSTGIMSWISDQADKCGIEPTAELGEWRLRSKNVSSEHLAQSNIVRHLEKQDQEDFDDMSGGDGQKEKLESES